MDKYKRTIFLVRNEARKYELKAALANCKQSRDSVSVYRQH